MKKKLTLMVSILAIAFLGFAAAAYAQQATVFGDGVLVRAYINAQDSSGNDCAAGLYSAYLEVRNNDGTVITGSDTFSVVEVMGTEPPLTDSTKNPVQIHNCTLTNTDISITYDNSSKTVYVLCIDAVDKTTPHVMTYDIGFTTPVNGVCGSANGQAFISTPATNLCNPGTPSTVGGNGPWNWTCGGLYNGNPSDICSANVLACGSSNGGTFSTTPPNLCATAGTASPVSNNGTQWTWTCSGADGRVNCSASVQAGLPDLTIRGSLGSSSFNAGGSGTATVTVTNNGNAPATGQWYVTGVLVNSTAFTWYPGDLGPGQSITQQINFNYPSAGSLHMWLKFVFKADAGGQVTESNESNNTAQTSVYRAR